MYSALIHKGDLGQIALLVAMIVFMVVMYKILPKDKDYYPPLEPEEESEEAQT
jgi:hypothetical protein